MSKKYIIEIDDKSKNGLYKATNFNTLVFDKKGLDRLTPYKEPKPEKSEKKYKPWRADRGKEYWCLADIGCPVERIENNDFFDDWNYKSGNYFQTEEEVKFHKEEILVYNELKAYASLYNKRSYNDKLRYSLIWDGVSEVLKIDFYKYTQHGDLKFETKEAVEQAIDAVGEGRIKKYYLHIWEDDKKDE